MSEKILVLSLGSKSSQMTGLLCNALIEKAVSLGLSTDHLIFRDEDQGLLENDISMNVMDVLLQQDDMEEVFEKITSANLVVFFAAV